MLNEPCPVRMPAVLAIGLVIFLAWIAGCTGVPVTGCPGGCPEGLVCDHDTGRCIEPRPNACPLDLGRYLSAKVDTAGQVVFSTYTAYYGDLVVGRVSEEGCTGCEYVDGVDKTDGDPDLLGDDVGLYSSLALDLLDRPHVAYFDRTHGRLKYAWRSGEGWEVVTVPRRGENHNVVGQACSLALDSEGLPHIAFLDETDGALKVARKSSGGAWSVEKIPVQGRDDDWPGAFDRTVGRTVSLVLDGKDREWIAFRDIRVGGLKVAGYQPDGWSVIEVDPDPEAGAWVSAALDQDGNVAVAYHHGAGGSLNYASNRDGSLEQVVVDDGTFTHANGTRRQLPVGQHCALAFGYDGLPRILYLDGGGLELKLAEGVRDGGFAKPGVLDGQGAVGFFASLTRGQQGLDALACRFARDDENVLHGEIVHHQIEAGRSSLGGPW